jgi:hypothetical protein
VFLRLVEVDDDAEVVAVVRVALRAPPDERLAARRQPTLAKAVEDRAKGLCIRAREIRDNGIVDHQRNSIRVVGIGRLRD